MVIDLEQAKTIAVALTVYNKKLVEEFEKIAYAGDDVSEFIKEAAHNRYQELTEAGTKLHVELAQNFPELTQR